MRLYAASKKSNEKVNGIIVNDTLMYDVEHQEEPAIDISDSIRTQGFYKNIDETLTPAGR